MTADKDVRSITLTYWQGMSETHDGKGQLTANVCQRAFCSQHSGFLVRCVMLTGTVGVFHLFLVTSLLQKRGHLGFKLHLTRSQNPQPEM